MYGRITSRPPVRLPENITPRHWATVPGVTYPAEKTPPLTVIPPGYAPASTLAKQLGITSTTLRNTLRQHNCPRHTIIATAGRPRNVYHIATARQLYHTLHPGATLATIPPGWLTTAQARTLARCSNTTLIRRARAGTLRTRRVTLPDTTGRLRTQNLYAAADLTTPPKKTD